MKKVVLIFVSLLLCFPAVARRKPRRPRILGIAGVTIFVSDIPAARRFYQQLIDPQHICDYCENTPSQYLFLPSGQRIMFKRMPVPAPSDLIAEISFLTDDPYAFEKYLKSEKIEFSEIKRKHTGDLVSLLLQDPEGHPLSIITSYNLVHLEDQNVGLPPSPPASPVRIIHTGFVVKDRAAIDHFYKDQLGFRPYWHGGMKDDGKDDWVAMQVPDGTDWVEYMLRISPNADKHTLGVMNHISLGVPDIHVAEQQLLKAGVKPGEQPKIGRDGKWQLNLYDADDTRVEFMEFKPVEKPCCSEFTGEHPEPPSQFGSVNPQ